MESRPVLKSNGCRDIIVFVRRPVADPGGLDRARASPPFLQAKIHENTNSVVASCACAGDLVHPYKLCTGTMNNLITCIFTWSYMGYK